MGGRLEGPFTVMILRDALRAPQDEVSTLKPITKRLIFFRVHQPVQL